MTKAETKRIADNTRFINAQLVRVTAQMKNDYLEAVGNWAVAAIELKLDRVLKDELTTRGLTKEQHAKSLTQQLTKKTMLSLNAMKEEEINFDGKIENVAAKMVKFGLTNVHFKVQEIKAKMGEIEFIAHNDDFQVHARAIFVNGDIKAPHYRFITTKKMF